MSKKILITGAAGYIGQHLAKLLQCKLLRARYKFEVWGIDKNLPSPHGALCLDNFIHKDILKIDEEMRFDCVIHLAALVQVGESVKNPVDYYETNIMGTLNLLRHVKCNNFVFASTGAAAQPQSPYAYSKLAAEHIVRQYCTQNGIHHTIFRFYNVIGSSGFEPTNPDGLFYNLNKAVATGTFNLYGDDYNTPDGSAIRDYVHVMEICNAIETAIHKPASPDGAEYGSLMENLGHGKGHSVKEIIETYKKVNNVNFDIVTKPRRSGDIEISVLDDVSIYMNSLYTLEELVRR